MDGSDLSLQPNLDNALPHIPLRGLRHDVASNHDRANQNLQLEGFLCIPKLLILFLTRGAGFVYKF